jgi:hypothetical protein
MRFQMSNCFFQGFLYSQQMQSQIRQQLAETSAKPPSAKVVPNSVPMYQGEKGREKAPEQYMQQMMLGQVIRALLPPI